jgi:hypothetical protein
VKKTSIKGGGRRRRRRASYHKMNNNKKLDPIHKPILKGGKISSKQSKNNKTREIYVWRRVLLQKLRWSKPAAKSKTKKKKNKTQMKICKERFNKNDGCFCLAIPQTHTERHRPDRQRGKEMRKMQWKSRKARGSREKRETRSVHEQVEQHLQERKNLIQVHC